jgi:Mitochondrial protein Pet127
MVPVEPDADVGAELQLPPHLDSREFTGHIASGDIHFERLDRENSVQAATLCHGLSRVLFSPGVHWLQDPRSAVWNFDPALSRLPYPAQFDFGKLRPFVPPSRDKSLRELLKVHERKFAGSTSSMTGMLSHIWIALRGGNTDLNLDMLSEAFLFQVGALVLSYLERN